MPTYPYGAQPQRIPQDLTKEFLQEHYTYSPFGILLPKKSRIDPFDGDAVLKYAKYSTRKSARKGGAVCLIMEDHPTIYSCPIQCVVWRYHHEPTKFPERVVQLIPEEGTGIENLTIWRNPITKRLLRKVFDPKLLTLVSGAAHWQCIRKPDGKPHVLELYGIRYTLKYLLWVYHYGVPQPPFKVFMIRSSGPVEIENLILSESQKAVRYHVEMHRRYNVINKGPYTYA